MHLEPLEVSRPAAIHAAHWLFASPKLTIWSTAFIIALCVQCTSPVASCRKSRPQKGTKKMALRISTSVRNACLNAVTSTLDGGSGVSTVELYTGAVPGSFGAAPSGTKLATCTFSFPSFGAASAGVMTAASITSDSSADASGTVGCFCVKDHAGAVCVDGSCTATGGGGQIEFDVTSITSGATVAITSLTISQPQS